MGWKALYKDGTILEEGSVARPVQAGEEGLLALIAQEDFGHNIAIDLVNGVILFEYTFLRAQNGTVEIDPKYKIAICDETNIVGELYDVVKSDPDEDGWFSQEIVPIQWRPIWFTRITNGIPTKVIGAQATLPEMYGGKNVKKLVSLFSDGKLGID
jgi:hypothetical protein